MAKQRSGILQEFSVSVTVFSGGLETTQINYNSFRKNARAAVDGVGKESRS